MFATQLDPRFSTTQRQLRRPPPPAPSEELLARGPMGASRRSRCASSCACGGGCPKCSGTRESNAPGRRAARDGAGLDADTTAVPAAAPAEAPATPAFRDCRESITGIADSNERLETARQRGREFVGAARRVLGAAPTAGTVYETALARHFIAPSDAQRATIADTFGQILNTLVVRNYICNSQNICGAEQAFWIEADDLIHVCRPFWELSPTCRAIILLHEGAHDVGIGVAGAHPPNRGDAEYPAGNVAPPATETTAGRMDNPDAYAFFASHIWRDTDTSRTCF